MEPALGRFDNAMETLKRFALPLILAVGFALRVYVAFFAGADPMTFDSGIYLRMVDGIVNEAPISAFPNGYPLLLSTLRLALSGDAFVQAILGMNVVLSTATLWLAWRLTRLASPRHPKAALAVAAALAVFPHQLRYVQLVMSEVPCLFLLALGFWLWLESDDGERAASAEFLTQRFLAGLALNMACSIRPSVILALPLAMIAAFALKRPWKANAAVAAGWLVGLALLIGVEKVGIVRPTHAADNNLLVSITSESNNVGFVQYSPEQQAAAKKTYIQFALKQPGKYVRQRAISVWELWGPKSLPGYRLEKESALVKLVILLRPLLLFLSLFSLWTFRRSFWAWALFSPALGVTIIHTLTFSNHRFLAPVEPELFALAAVGIPHLRYTITRVFARRGGVDGARKV